MAETAKSDADIMILRFISGKREIWTKSTKKEVENSSTSS
jgi:hypothetical protein